MNLNRQRPIVATLRSIERGSGNSAQRRDFAALLTSATLHAVVLLVLAFWVLPTFSVGKSTLQVSVGDDFTDSLASFDISTELAPPATESADVPSEVEDPLEPISMDLMFDATEPMFDPSQPGTQPDDAIGSFLPSEISEDTLSTSTSVEGAVDRITAELIAKLQNGDLLVVWLLDSSNSLVDDRQRVAARLAPFYENLVGGRPSSKHELVSAVVSFGNAMRERVAPTNFGEQIVSAVGDLPVDRSGNEKVFDAVAKCASHYRNSWPEHQVSIVIWTDESGDDVQNLERAINVCRENSVAVSVVGPSSVLGADTGLHSYTDPKTDSVYQLPVRRGPESAMPERIELGYWYLTGMWLGARGSDNRNGPGRGDQRGGQRGGWRRRGPLPSWLGGQDLEGILSGFSPYALTRLTMQTGGSYTIFDRQEDRGPYDWKAMQRYAPSYGSYASYKADIEAHPLRLSIMTAVDELKGKKVDAPQTMLFIKVIGPRVFDFMRYYYPPMEFHSKLRSSRSRLLGQASRYSKIIDAALRHVSTDDTLEGGLDELYKYETSPRWRAWYDLTRGRLLATSVRLEEYRLTVSAMTKPGALAASTNHVVLVASPEMQSDAKFQRRADEAEFLLRRCVEQNRDTPWAMLAQRELDFALGVGVRERSLTPGPVSPVNTPNLPRF